MSGWVNAARPPRCGRSGGSSTCRHTSLPKRWRNSMASLVTCPPPPGPRVDVKDGTSASGDVGRVAGGAGVGRRRSERSDCSPPRGWWPPCDSRSDPARLSVSLTTPCPMKAASPWMSNGITGAEPSRRGGLAWPHAPFDTGFTHSRCSVERQREMHFVAGVGGVVGGIAEVILDVAAAQELLRVVVLEGGEDLADVLVQDVASTLSRPRGPWPTRSLPRPADRRFHQKTRAGE